MVYKSVHIKTKQPEIIKLLLSNALTNRAVIKKDINVV